MTVLGATWTSRWRVTKHEASACSDTGTSGQQLPRLICTASGKGRGGGWVLQPTEGTQTNLEWLADYLRSADHGEWLWANAEPNKGGWCARR